MQEKTSRPGSREQEARREHIHNTPSVSAFKNISPVLLFLMLASNEDPALTERRLLDTLSDWENYSQGQIISWLERMAGLPKKARQRVWIAMSYRLPKKTLKYIREWYHNRYPPTGGDEE